jgi:pimeloyl-ACP methyl ester carboxylesterase
MDSPQMLGSSLGVAIASKAILRPSRNPIDYGSQERFWIKTPWGRQEVFRQDRMIGEGKPQQLFIKLPGSSGRAERATMFPLDRLETSSSVVTWNPPGFGASEGNAHLEIHCRSVPLLYDQCRAIPEFQDVPIYVLGNSLGGALAIYLATERSVAGLILCNPPSLPELLRRYNRWWNLGLGGTWIGRCLPGALATIELAKRCDTPAVFVTSLQDKIVPATLQKEIRAAYQGHLYPIEVAEAGHELRLGDLPILQMKKALNWLLAGGSETV